MAFWQAWIFSLLELALTVLVSLYARDYPFALLTWAFAAFVFEFSQIWGRHTTRSTGGFWGLLLSYFHQDSFNVLDIGALAVTNAALGYACYEKLGGSVGIVDPMIALSILLLWIRQRRRASDKQWWSCRAEPPQPPQHQRDVGPKHSVV